MRRYKVRINCGCYEDIEVEANDKEQAKEEAIKLFSCQGNNGEFCEFIYD